MTLLPQGPFWHPFVFGAGIFGVRYLMLAVAAFLAWYARRARGKLHPAMPRAADIRREIAYSMAAFVIFGLINAVIFGYGIVPYTQLYFRVADHGWLYFWLSIPLMILVHDTWFYWIHRLMHTRALFRLFHGVHHLSRNPTPFAAYSFHPYESVLEALGIVLIFFIMPSHPLALLIFQTVSAVINVYGHLGYELYPRGFAQHPLGRWINTSVAHNAHHEKARHNFGFYFLLWDRWMGTLDPAYEARYREKKLAALAP